MSNKEELTTSNSQRSHAVEGETGRANDSSVRLANNIDTMNGNNNKNNNNTYKNDGPTAMQLTIAALVLGTSAGFTLYTKKVGSMLRTMNQINENVAKNRPPPKFGPPTKAEYEKFRPRWDDKDDFI